MIRALRVLRGLSELPPWINFFVTFWCYIQKNVYLCTQQGKWWPEGHSEKPLKKGFIWCQSITIWHHHRSRWSPTTPSNRKRKWRRIALSLFFYRRRKPTLWQPPFSKGQPRYWDWYHIGSRNRRTILRRKEDQVDSEKMFVNLMNIALFREEIRKYQ